MRHLPVLLCVLLLLLGSCGDDRDCKDCDNAIQHMCEKMPANSCNGQFMQDARDQVEEHCGPENTAVYVAYMEETCLRGGIVCPPCFSPLPTISDLDMILRSTSTVSDTVRIEITVGGGLRASYLLPAKETLFVKYSTAREDDDLRVEVLAHPSGVAQINETQTFTFVRSSKTATRAIDLSFDILTGYDLTFVNW